MRRSVCDFLFKGNFEILGKEAAAIVSRSASGYAAAGIDLEILEFEPATKTAKVKITQARLINGYILNQKQLVDRVKEMFESTGIHTKVIPMVFQLDVSRVNIQWIESKMKEFGISRNDIIKQLAIDKSSLSLLLSGARGLEKSTRAMFYFYFLTYELNRDLRAAV